MITVKFSKPTAFIPPRNGKLSLEIFDDEWEGIRHVDVKSIVVLTEGCNLVEYSDMNSLKTLVYPNGGSIHFQNHKDMTFRLILNRGDTTEEILVKPQENENNFVIRTRGKCLNIPVIKGFQGKVWYGYPISKYRTKIEWGIDTISSEENQYKPESVRMDRISDSFEHISHDDKYIEINMLEIDRLKGIESEEFGIHEIILNDGNTPFKIEALRNETEMKVLYPLPKNTRAIKKVLDHVNWFINLER